MKTMMEINQLEEMVDDSIGVFVVNPTRVASKLHDSMFHLDYKLDQSIDVSVYLEVKAEGLCLIKCTKINNQMKQWDDVLLKK